MKWFSIFLFSALMAGAGAAPGDNSSQVAQPDVQASLTRSGGIVARTTPDKQTSGALVKAAQARNPAQLINPRAPKQYGTGWDNVSFDPITGHAQGIKLFAIG